jgi:hypothetical protein
MDKHRKSCINRFQLSWIKIITGLVPRPPTTLIPVILFHLATKTKASVILTEDREN